MDIKLTKTDMARVIVQSLYGLTLLPDEDHIQVKRIARRSKNELRERHKKAIDVINAKMCRR